MPNESRMCIARSAPPREYIRAPCKQKAERVPKVVASICDKSNRLSMDAVNNLCHHKANVEERSDRRVSLCHG